MSNVPQITPPPFPQAPPPHPKQPLPVLHAVLLALFLGPIGLAFTNLPAAVFTGFVALVIGLFTYGSGLPPVFIFCAVIAFVIAPRRHQPGE
jgi:hypothetical protein